MKWRSLITLVILFLAGCVPGAETNRIFSKRPATTVAAPMGQALVVGISQLQQAPEAYEGTLVRVTSQYRRAPVIVCDGIARPSPATWRLGEGEQLVGARGFEELVQILLPPGITITVDGVWRFWRGPIGCGKDAPVQSVWYLSVMDIVSPSPVARVTLTPTGGEPEVTPDDTAEAPAETPTSSGPDPVGTPVTVPSPTVVATTRPPATQVAPTATSDATATLSASPTAEDDEESTSEPTGTETATATIEGTLAATATADGAVTATPAASETPGGSVVDKGSVGYQDLRGGRLNSNETNSWQFPVEAGDVITISVAARTGTDISLTVLDPAGNRIVQQNESPAGEMEIIAGLEAGGSGGYRVVIAEAGGAETYYSILLLNSNYDDYYTFIFAGMLSYGSSATSSMADYTDQFWFFFGNSQDVVNINVAPNDQSDIFFDLFGPEGDLLQEIDDGEGGNAEQLLNFRLPSTGMYAIRVGEYVYAPSNFTILVARN